MVYRPGTSNMDADGISRFPEIEIENDQQTQIPSESVKTVCSMSMNAHSYIVCLGFSSQVIYDIKSVIQGQCDGYIKGGTKGGTKNRSSAIYVDKVQRW